MICDSVIREKSKNAPLGTVPDGAFLGFLVPVWGLFLAQHVLEGVKCFAHNLGSLAVE